MFNFIICDDNINDAKKVEKIVKNFMHHINYKIHLFNDYNEAFFTIVNEDLSNKIYLLDIEMPSMSGIDVARRIRKHDYTSVIIFLTGHDDLSRIVAKKNLLALNFINKFDNFENNLIASLKLSLSIVGQKRLLHLTVKGVVYNIELSKILYITRDTISRKSIIVCDNRSYELKMNMKDITKELSDDFVQTHRACYINKGRVSVIDTKNMCITFDNGYNINLLSKRYIERMITQ